MSTQRRANRITPAIEIDCTGTRRRWFRGCMERVGISISAARTGGLLASVITAPLVSIIWLAWVWFSTPATRVRRRGSRELRSCDQGPRAKTFRVATNSLQSDYWFESFAGIGSVSGSPPRYRAGGSRLPDPQATHRSSLPHISVLPVRTDLYPPLPQAPAGTVRWAERHDGKRDLYFQHAA